MGSCYVWHSIELNDWSHLRINAESERVFSYKAGVWLPKQD